MDTVAELAKFSLTSIRDKPCNENGLLATFDTAGDIRWYVTPVHLPHLPAVAEFPEHIGTTPLQTRVAVLAFDKLDVEKGMEICGPHGETRWLKHPWSVLAFQIAGNDGLRLLHAEGERGGT